MISLVGYTGFVGSNLYASGRKSIDRGYNSKNIREAYGTNPDLLIYAGMRAEKYLANANPEADMQLVYEAEENIQKICPAKLVLISTIDVFRDPNGRDEDSEIETEALSAYGRNRYRLEQWVREYDPDALIIRLPALYGKNLKKNFLYDFIHIIPSMLKEDKWNNLCGRDNDLKNYYEKQDNEFYKCRTLTERETAILKNKFQQLGFTALQFTDSRNVYQFYPLSRLWGDLQTALRLGLTVWHAATEPVSAGEVYQYLTGKPFINEITASPVHYDYRTNYANLFGGASGYLMTRAQVLENIKTFTGGSNL